MNQSRCRYEIVVVLVSGPVIYVRVTHSTLSVATKQGGSSNTRKLTSETRVSICELVSLALFAASGRFSRSW